MMTMHQIGNRYELLFLTSILSATIAPFFSVCLQVECGTGGLHGQTVLQDIKPRFHHSRIHGADGAEEDEEEDDIINSWNLRKCSAAGLDILSTVFGDEILPILMPLVQVRLSTTTDAAWKEREAAVLALGAVAEGCISGLLPHMSQVPSS
jgi:hypothetical protein